MKNSGSKYCYPGTFVLINKLDIRDYDDLVKAERQTTGFRLAELQKKPIYGQFGLKHLQKIHNHIFQDIYPFAGKFRDVGISKGGTAFAPPFAINSYGSQVLKQLKEERFLKGTSKEEFAERASYYLSEINMFHPFREGNGRTQREFFRLLGMKNGYRINWSEISREEMLESSINGKVDETAFKDVFIKAIQNDEPDQSLIKEFSSLKIEKGIELEL